MSGPDRSAGVSSEPVERGARALHRLAYRDGFPAWNNASEEARTRYYEQAVAVLRAAESPALEEAVKALEYIAEVNDALHPEAASDAALRTMHIMREKARVALAALRQPDGGNEQ